MKRSQLSHHGFFIQIWVLKYNKVTLIIWFFKLLSGSIGRSPEFTYSPFFYLTTLSFQLKVKYRQFQLESLTVTQNSPGSGSQVIFKNQSSASGIKPSRSALAFNLGNSKRSGQPDSERDPPDPLAACFISTCLILLFYEIDCVLSHEHICHFAGVVELIPAFYAV